VRRTLDARHARMQEGPVLTRVEVPPHTLVGVVATGQLPPAGRDSASGCRPRVRPRGRRAPRSCPTRPGRCATVLESPEWSRRASCPAPTTSWSSVVPWRADNQQGSACWRYPLTPGAQPRVQGRRRRRAQRARPGGEAAVVADPSAGYPRRSRNDQFPAHPIIVRKLPRRRRTWTASWAWRSCDALSWNSIT
jgi:hypothetical protein